MPILPAIHTTPNILISDAEVQDFAEIQRIYAPYVLNTCVSLEEIPPSVEDMQNRWQQSVDRGLPYLVAKIDGKIAGYAYAVPYRTRSAYRFTLEESVYVADGFQGQGIGRKLLGALIAKTKEKGYKQMIAVIGDAGNDTSIKFHEALGFRHVGLLKNTGFKFGKWVDTILMQKEL